MHQLLTEEVKRIVCYCLQGVRFSLFTTLFIPSASPALMLPPPNTEANNAPGTIDYVYRCMLKSLTLTEKKILLFLLYSSVWGSDSERRQFSRSVGNVLTASSTHWGWAAVESPFICWKSLPGSCSHPKTEGRSETFWRLNDSQLNLKLREWEEECTVSTLLVRSSSPTRGFRGTGLWSQTVIRLRNSVTLL